MDTAIRAVMHVITLIRTPQKRNIVLAGLAGFMLRGGSISSVSTAGLVTVAVLVVTVLLATGVLATTRLSLKGGGGGGSDGSSDSEGLSPHANVFAVVEHPAVIRYSKEIISSHYFNNDPEKIVPAAKLYASQGVPKPLDVELGRPPPTLPPHILYLVLYVVGASHPFYFLGFGCA